MQRACKNYGPHENFNRDAPVTNVDDIPREKNQSCQQGAHWSPL